MLVDLANRSPMSSPAGRTRALRRIGALHAIEALIRSQSPAYRLAERRTFSSRLSTL
ncbi:hypothetical protein [Bradyrhizobium sp. SZCCHNRI1009]|nr:hypothetical protein [Bradyrhizobium sp. SZCCHNRI1009]